MSLVLQSVLKDDSRPHSVDAHYQLQHCSPGRNGTTLSLAVQLRLSPMFGEIEASVLDLAPKVKTTDPEVALDKLAEWLERAAAALRARGAPAPLLNAYPNADA